MISESILTDADQVSIVKFCLSLLREKDISLYRHSLNVRLIASRLHRALELTPESGAIIEVGSLLHDFGKIVLPSVILKKNGTYENVEFEMMQRHTILGHDQIKHLNTFMPNQVLEIIMSHHEKNGGHGYPKQIQELPLHVEVVAVSDICVAMQEHRYYRSGHTLKQSLEEILKYEWSDPITRLLLSQPDLFILEDKYKTITVEEEARMSPVVIVN